jgi:hypothetical protein
VALGHGFVSAYSRPSTPHFLAKLEMRSRKIEIEVDENETADYDQSES